MFYRNLTINRSDYFSEYSEFNLISFGYLNPRRDIVIFIKKKRGEKQRGPICIAFSQNSNNGQVHS